MKRLISLLLLLCACGPVWAKAAQYVSIVDLQEETADCWHQTYEAHGRTITIDVGTILVPAVDACLVLTVQAVDAVPAELLNGYEMILTNEPNDLMFVTRDYPHNRFYDGGKMRFTPDRQYFAEDRIDWDYRADGSPYTTRQAVDVLLDETVRLYGRDVADSMAVTWLMIETKALRYNAAADGYGEPFDHPDNKGSYTIEMAQGLHGIPVLYASGGEFEFRPGEERRGAASHFTGSVHDEGCFMYGMSLVQETEEVAADVPLRPFSDIQGALEELIAQGRLRGLQSIRLGYVLYLDPQDPAEDWAVPTWVCYGELYEDARQEPIYAKNQSGGDEAFPHTGYVMIRAQTGTFIDPLDMSPTRRNVPKIITWNEVKQ